MPWLFLLDGPSLVHLIYVAILFPVPNRYKCRHMCLWTPCFVPQSPTPPTAFQTSTLAELLNSFNYYSFSISFTICTSSPLSYIFLKLALIVLGFYILNFRFLLKLHRIYKTRNGPKIFPSMNTFIHLGIH